MVLVDEFWCMPPGFNVIATSPGFEDNIVAPLPGCHFPTPGFEDDIVALSPISLPMPMPESLLTLIPESTPKAIPMPMSLPKPKTNMSLLLCPSPLVQVCQCGILFVTPRVVPLEGGSAYIFLSWSKCHVCFHPWWTSPHCMTQVSSCFLVHAT